MTFDRASPNQLHTFAPKSEFLAEVLRGKDIGERGDSGQMRGWPATDAPNSLAARGFALALN
jgi:hypothetical protein